MALGFDAVFCWATIVTSSVASATKATLYNLTGIGSDDHDDLGEAATEQEVMTALGIIARPRPPKKGADKITRFAEALGVRTSDGLIPIGTRDRRLHEKFPSPKEGTIALVGYGGAFLSFDDTSEKSGDEQATLATLYVPYEYSNGVAAKAHALLFDPITNTVVLVHGDGGAVVLSENEVTLRAPGGGNSLVLDDDGLRVYGNVRVMGRMVVGIPTVGTPPAGIPVLAGTPGSPIASIDLMVATPS